MKVTNDDLDRVANDEEAQRLLVEAARKKAEFWDALSELEQRVGLEFKSDDVPAVYNYSGFGETTLKRVLKEGFEHKALLHETGIAIISETG
jgi:nicotinamidase-related amidase